MEYTIRSWMFFQDILKYNENFCSPGCFDVSHVFWFIWNEIFLDCLWSFTLKMTSWNITFWIRLKTKKAYYRNRYSQSIHSYDNFLHIHFFLFFLLQNLYASPTRYYVYIICTLKLYLVEKISSFFFVFNKRMYLYHCRRTRPIRESART